VQREKDEKEKKECDWSYQLMEFYSVEINFNKNQSVGLIEFAIDEACIRVHTTRT
jgi:hypothetical protein